MVKRRVDLRDQSGQAVTEYILLLSIVVAAFLLLSKGITDVGLSGKLLTPVKEDFANTYRYGHPKAKGFEDGGPLNHPRAYTGGSNNNFRLFINRTN